MPDKLIYKLDGHVATLILNQPDLRDPVTDITRVKNHEPKTHLDHGMGVDADCGSPSAGGGNRIRAAGRSIDGGHDFQGLCSVS